MTPRPSRRHVARRGFSLIEILLAIGVISIGVVAILGMFPVAVRSADDSRQETQAALIARAIFEELRSQSTAERHFTASTNLEDEDARVSVDLGSQATKRDLAAYDADGAPLRGDGAAATAPYVVDLTVEPRPSPAGLAQVTLTVRTPTAEYPFVTLLRSE